MTLQELKNDCNFFKNLTEGKYCLVLGAGFSYGVPCKYKDTSHFLNTTSGKPTLPVVKDYVSVTNMKFSENFSETDYNTPTEKWIEYIEENPEKKDERFEEFSTLFLVNEESFKSDLNLYKYILEPNWINIYTFNFDNLLNVLIKGREDDYEIQYYDSGSFSNRGKTGIGYLHNSILNAKSINDLVFTNEQYGIKIQSKDADNHLYYALLNDIVSHKKGLIVIGSQFNEQTIYSYLFNERRNIPDDFEIINIKRSTPPNYGHNTKKFLKNKKWINCSARDFITFLKENIDLYQSDPYPGSVLIDEKFRDKLESLSYEPEQFYISKTKENCQWFGIYKEWDVKRDSFEDIKNKVLESFEDTERSNTVSAVVNGVGGSGKSTLLRRLAFDLLGKNIKILWIDNFDDFNKSVFKIEKNSETKYLIIIEDWYRLSQYFNLSIYSTFSRLVKLPNVRIVIGDRGKATTKKYSEYIYNGNTYELKIDENRKIIDGIISKIPIWEKAKNLVFEKEGISKITLFLLLFVIARTAKDLQENVNVDFDDIESHFVEIIKSDIKKINYEYPGLAQTLIFWSNIYKSRKFAISTDSFIAIAKYLNKDNKIDYFNLKDGHTKTNDLLNTYINIYEYIYQGKTEKILAIKFNHDILAEKGLSKIFLYGWSEFDEVMKKELFDVIFKNDNDGYVISNYLFTLLEEKDVFATNEMKKEYIYKLLNNNNVHNKYLSYIFTDNSTFTKLDKIFFAKYILEKHYKDNMLYPIICNCLEVLNGTNEGISYSKKLIELSKTEKLAYQIICNCIENLSGTEEGRAIALEQLEINRNKKVDHQVICNCLENLKGAEEGVGYAIEFLNKQRTEKVEYQIVCKSLELLFDTEEEIKFAKELLVKSYTECIDKPIICSCLEILRGTKEGMEYAKDYMKKNGTEIKDFELICKCLENLKGTNLGKQYAREFLNKDKTESIGHQIVCVCLDLLKGTEVGTDYAKEYLQNRENKHWYVIYVALQCIEDVNLDSELVNNIINDFKTNPKKSGNFNQYINLFKIPFFINPEWKKEVQHHLKIWKKESRKYITNIIYAHIIKRRTRDIREHCKSILLNWKIEVLKQQNRRKGIYYWKHIYYSLGHPDLKKLAGKVFLEMDKFNSENRFVLPFKLVRKIEKYKSNNELPTWNIKKRNILEI